MNESLNAHTDVFLELPSDPGLQKVVCPPEHFISVAAPDLARALQSAPSLPSISTCVICQHYTGQLLYLHAHVQSGFCPMHVCDSRIQLHCASMSGQG